MIRKENFQALNLIRLDKVSSLEVTTGLDFEIVKSRFRAFTFSSSREPGKQWEEAGTTQIENFYTVTAISWKRDGSCVAIGSLTGALELYDIALKYFHDFYRLFTLLGNLNIKENLKLFM